MNMSDDVTSATIQVTTKVVTETAHAAASVIDTIGKLLKELAIMARNSQQRKEAQKVTATDLTNIKNGAVSLKTLYASARQQGDTITTSQQGLSKEDVKRISQQAKKSGIPVSFSKIVGQDLYYANVRTGDLPIFKQICTACLKNKLAAHPQELGNFKCQKWEIPFLTAELNRYGLTADFAQTKDDGYFCVYQNADDKAIMIARQEFQKKCSEIEREITIQKDDSGFYSIKNQRTGQEITFDELPNREILSQQLQGQFGFDKNKADVICAKFGEEQLTGTEKELYFSNDPQTAFSEIKTNVELEGEDILTKPYSCYRLTPRTDGIPRIVFQNESDQFAVLHPEKQTRSQMRLILAADLGVTDKAEQNALIDKAEKTAYYFGKKNQQSYAYEAAVDTSSKVISNIDRTDNNHFTVTSDYESTMIDDDGKETTNRSNASLILSFSNKRDALQQLQELYQKQGVPKQAAKQMANEVYRKAAAQSAEKVLHIEEIKADTVIVSQGNRAVSVPRNREAMIDSLQAEFHVDGADAEIIANKVDEMTMPNLDESNLAVKDIRLNEIDEHHRASMESIHDDPSAIETQPLGANGHEQHPEGNMLADISDSLSEADEAASSVRR